MASSQARRFAIEVHQQRTAALTALHKTTQDTLTVLRSIVLSSREMLRQLPRYVCNSAIHLLEKHSTNPCQAHILSLSEVTPPMPLEEWVPHIHTLQQGSIKEKWILSSVYSAALPLESLYIEMSKMKDKLHIILTQELPIYDPNLTSGQNHSALFQHGYTQRALVAEALEHQLIPTQDILEGVVSDLYAQVSRIPRAELDEFRSEILTPSPLRCASSYPL